MTMLHGDGGIVESGVTAARLRAAFVFDTIGSIAYRQGGLLNFVFAARTFNLFFKAGGFVTRQVSKRRGTNGSNEAQAWCATG